MEYPDETEMQLLTSTMLLMWYSPDCLTPGAAWLLLRCGIRGGICPGLCRRCGWQQCGGSLQSCPSDIRRPAWPGRHQRPAAAPGNLVPHWLCSAECPAPRPDTQNGLLPKWKNASLLLLSWVVAVPGFAGKGCPPQKGDCGMKCKKPRKIFRFCEALFGGKMGIRTPERFYTLHDFQSCALDQLSHLSTYSLEGVPDCVPQLPQYYLTR